MAVLKFSLPEKRFKIKAFLFVYLNNFHKPDCILLFVKVVRLRVVMMTHVCHSSLKKFIRSPNGHQRNYY